MLRAPVRRISTWMSQSSSLKRQEAEEGDVTGQRTPYSPTSALCLHSAGGRGGCRAPCEARWQLKKANPFRHK